MKITKSVLRMKIGYLNYITNREDPKNEDGYYALDYGYNGVKVVLCSAYGGITAEMSPRGTKTEIGIILDSMIMVYERELMRAKGECD
jgi:hypothetical protein